MTLTWTQRLAALNISLPAPAAPVASYIPAIQIGTMVYTSGQLPFHEGHLLYQGKVDENITLLQAQECAQACVLNALAAIDRLVGVDTICRIIKLTGFVASSSGFHDHPLVINGASDLLTQIFGPAGQHTRSAVGVYELPLGAPVEVELLAEITVM